MKIIKTYIKDLTLIKSTTFSDNRGLFREVDKQNILKKKFVFDCFSYSKKNTLRGLHLQTKKSQAKIITVVHGKILDVVVDLRKKSKTFGKHFKIKLSDKNNKFLFVPKGFAHGFLGLDKENLVLYSLTNYRSVKAERSLLWKDKNLKINWGIKKPIVSKRDSEAKTFKEIINSNEF